MNKILWSIAYLVSTLFLVYYFIKEKKIENYIKNLLSKTTFGKKIQSVIYHIVTWSITIVLVIFIQFLYLGNFKVPTGSMEPTIEIGDRFFSNMFLSRFKAPDRDNIVMFIEPVNEKLKYTKRLIALPSETIHISYNGNIEINGKVLKNKRIYSKAGALGGNTWTVPKKGDIISLKNPKLLIKSDVMDFRQMKKSIKDGSLKDIENLSIDNMIFTVNGEIFREGLFAYITDRDEIMTLLSGEELIKNGKKFKIYSGHFFTTYTLSDRSKFKDYLDNEYTLVGGKFLLNGKALTGPISNKEILNRLIMGENVTLKENYYFMLGDNTNNSYDSRYWGFVKESAIKGNLLLRYWPLNRFRIMSGE